MWLYLGQSGYKYECPFRHTCYLKCSRNLKNVSTHPPPPPPPPLQHTKYPTTILRWCIDKSMSLNTYPNRLSPSSRFSYCKLSNDFFWNAISFEDETWGSVVIESLGMGSLMSLTPLLTSCLEIPLRFLDAFCIFSASSLVWISMGLRFRYLCL